MAKTNLEPLSGPQALVAYVMMHNTSGRNAFYELEHRVDVAGVHAVYLRYGTLGSATKERGGQCSVIARGTLPSVEALQDRELEKEGRGYRVVSRTIHAKSLHDGSRFVSEEELRSQRRRVTNEHQIAAVKVALVESGTQKALESWKSNVLFG